MQEEEEGRGEPQKLLQVNPIATRVVVLARPCEIFHADN